MKILGLCGQSGAGKTTALRAFIDLGGVVCDSDAVSREVMSRGTPCTLEVIKVFGDSIANDLEIDRKKLGSIVFGDPERLSVLTEITHRYIIAEIRRRIAEARDSGKELFVIDAPLLFESGLDAECDVTLAIIADRETRLRRITERDFVSRELAEKRIDSQLSEEKLRALADEVIDNNSEVDALLKKVREFAERRGLVN